ncbi:MAG: SPOR domain-containing protein, partial [Gammaproteobacteria bacterium]|nr:SPOR domain-containing protein [Gammaproteobacteria bacterium]
VEQTVVEAAVATKPAAGKSGSRSTAKAPQKPVAKRGAAPPEGYYVQVNAFAEQQNADRYATEIGSAGFDVAVIRGRASSGTIYRVYSGPEESRDSASDLAGRLADKGYQGIIVFLPGDQRG